MEIWAGMRLIFSRKGVDSASGGTRSPIFPDQTMFSLPIPDKQSPVPYEDITWNNRNVGALVSELTRGRMLATYRAHLDPDGASGKPHRRITARRQSFPP